MSRDDGAQSRNILESSGEANRDARKELLAYSSVLSFGQKIRSRSCEGCTDDEVHDDHPAEMTESLSDDTKWSHRFMRKGELYKGQNKGKVALGADCYYTHSVAWCDAQDGGTALAGRAAQVKVNSAGLSSKQKREQKKEQALAMDGANDYDMDCLYHHEISWCQALHAKQKTELKAKNFVRFAAKRNAAYSSDPELSGLAQMVHQSESPSQLREDEKMSRESRSEASKSEKASQDQQFREAHNARDAYAEREENDESVDHLHREAQQEARAHARARAQEARENTERESASAYDSHQLESVQAEALREKSVAEEELQQQLIAQQKEVAAEAELKAAKAQLHALASKKVTNNSAAGQSISLPILSRLPVEPLLENAQPIESRPQRNVAVPPALMRSRQDESDRETRMQRLHREYANQMRANEDISYPLSVRRQEPGGNMQVISSSIAWDKAHGVRPIDSMQQMRKGRSMELANWGQAHSQELADFTVSRGDDKSEFRRSGEPKQLEKEALTDGLTLVPLQKVASSMVHRGLSEDSRWEQKNGLKPVSARRLSRQQLPRSQLHAADLLKNEESKGDDWERTHQMIPFTGHKQERILGDNRVPISIAIHGPPQPASDSSLALRAVAEADQVGSAGVQALGFGNLGDFEKHLEHEGV